MPTTSTFSKRARALGPQAPLVYAPGERVDARQGAGDRVAGGRVGRELGRAQPVVADAALLVRVGDGAAPRARPSRRRPSACAAPSPRRSRREVDAAHVDGEREAGIVVQQRAEALEELVGHGDLLTPAHARRKGSERGARRRNAFASPPSLPRRAGPRAPELLARRRSAGVFRSTPMTLDFGINTGFVEELYAQYLENPASVDPGWRAHFDARLAVTLGDTPSPPVTMKDTARADGLPLVNGDLGAEPAGAAVRALPWGRAAGPRVALRRHARGARARRAGRGGHPGARLQAPQRVPRARPPLRAHRPAGLAQGRPVRARPAQLRSPPGGSRPALPHHRPRRHAPGGDAARDPPLPGGDVLPDHRRRVHLHPGSGAARLAARAHGVDAEPPRPRRGGAAPHPHQAHRRRDLRAVHPAQLRGRHQALLARGRGEPHPPARSAGGAVVAARRRGDRPRHGAPRPAQRPRQHHGQERARDLRRLRGRGSRALPRRRRRQVPPRLLDRSPHRLREERPPDDDVQPQPPRVRQPGGRGPRPRQAGAARPRRSALAAPRAAAPHPRRRGVHGPGRRRRDAQPHRARGLHHGRHRPRHRQQPDRLHHRPGGQPLHPLRVRHHAHAQGPCLPRERGGSGGGRPGRPPGRGVAPALRHGRRHRHVLLPPPRPQRGRRAALHPAA